jgi:hypothetical protein
MSYHSARIVKDSTFTARGNFAPPFKEGLLTSKRVLQKIKGNGSLKKGSDLQNSVLLIFMPEFT